MQQKGASEKECQKGTPKFVALLLLLAIGSQLALM
jgi:hypothetical protein